MIPILNLLEAVTVGKALVADSADFLFGPLTFSVAKQTMETDWVLEEQTFSETCASSVYLVM